jgi:hypothetical protein
LIPPKLPIEFLILPGYCKQAETFGLGNTFLLITLFRNCLA